MILSSKEWIFLFTIDIKCYFYNFIVLSYEPCAVKICPNHMFINDLLEFVGVYFLIVFKLGFLMFNKKQYWIKGIK